MKISNWSNFNENTDNSDNSNLEEYLFSMFYEAYMVVKNPNFHKALEEISNILGGPPAEGEEDNVFNDFKRASPEAKERITNLIKAFIDSLN